MVGISHDPTFQMIYTGRPGAVTLTAIGPAARRRAVAVARRQARACNRAGHGSAGPGMPRVPWSSLRSRKPAACNRENRKGTAPLQMSKTAPLQMSKTAGFWTPAVVAVIDERPLTRADQPVTILYYHVHTFEQK
jgi:hypothetical protein